MTKNTINSDLDKLHLLYAEFNEKAAGIFVKSQEKIHIDSAGYSFYRVALGYAKVGNVEKAKENLADADKIIFRENLRYKVVKTIKMLENHS